MVLLLGKTLADSLYDSTDVWNQKISFRKQRTSCAACRELCA